MTKEPAYILNISGGPVGVKNQKITEKQAWRILSLFMNNKEDGASEEHADGSQNTIHSEGSAGDSRGKTLTAKAFMAQKRPSSEIERITCLAYYLMKYGNTEAFKTRDLTKVNRDAAQPAFSNPAVFARNAVHAEYLAKAGGGAKQITDLGERIVESLPDREKVKAAIDEYRSSRKRRKKKKPRKNAS